MREIQLQGKAYASTRQLVDAVAWATNRRGRKAWTSKGNVAQDIYDYLIDHKVELPNHPGLHGAVHQLRNALKRLASEGYADMTQPSPGASYTMFKFKDDVDLNGHMPNFTTQSESAPLVVKSVPETTNLLDIPLPPGPKPERYLGAEIDRALDAWVERDPESYAKWAETLVERLEALNG